MMFKILSCTLAVTLMATSLWEQYAERRRTLLREEAALAAEGARVSRLLETSRGGTLNILLERARSQSPLRIACILLRDRAGTLLAGAGLAIAAQKPGAAFQVIHRPEGNLLVGSFPARWSSGNPWRLAATRGGGVVMQTGVIEIAIRLGGAPGAREHQDHFKEKTKLI